MLTKVNPDATVDISGMTWNLIVDKLTTIERQLKASKSDRGDSRFVRVQNNTDRKIEPFEIVKLGDPLPLPGAVAEDLGYQFQNVFKGESTDEMTRNYAIALTGIPDDVGGGEKGVGPVAMFGVTTAKVDVIDADHTYAKPSGTDGQLESTFCPTRIRILFSDTTGVKMVKVAINEPVQMLIGKPVETISVGSSGMVSIWRNGADTGEQVEVHLDWAHGGQQISAGKETGFFYFTDEDICRFLLAECEDAAAATINTNFNIAQVANLAGRDASLASGQMQMLARVDTNKLTYWTVSGAAGWTPLSKYGSVDDFEELSTLSEMENGQHMLVESELKNFVWLNEDGWVQV